ncbi:GNAT family N-acetyltransferase [Vibrio sonorensis]|uniref:GNAT family N-acetyltransferase n=1 Tax=Vibrio sonorensis TaxID=1004316 RepID=UPI0008D8E684|nr:GNAT family N-acetyltransferase [Vibrio sonorensis]
MKLIEFEKKDIPILQNWIDTEELCYQWAGPNFSFPLSELQIARHIADPDNNAFLLLDGDQVLGYAELNNKGEQTYRICRVFVSLDHRGKGISKHLIQAIKSLGENEYRAKKITLAVFEHNKPALACYSSLGFRIVKRVQNSVQIGEQYWHKLEMHLDV